MSYSELQGFAGVGTPPPRAAGPQAAGSDAGDMPRQGAAHAGSRWSFDVLTRQAIRKDGSITPRWIGITITVLLVEFTVIYVVFFA